MSQAIEAQVDQEVSIAGKAMNARMGAIVMLPDRTPVYLADKEEWDPADTGKSVTVSGTLRKRSLAPTAEVNEKGEVSHGMDGDNLVLENPTWTFDN